MKPITRSLSKKFNDNSHENKKSNITIDINDSIKRKVESKKMSYCKDELKARSNNEVKPSTNINNSAILTGFNESSWSYENYGFRSLPGRGNKKGRRPGIKFMINSETVSQTKVLVYKDHQKSNDVSNSAPTQNINKSQTNSSISLNSNDDPEIVAALDQIASEMGLIEHPVIRQSNDPINYLMATRSFSERISTNKSHLESNFDKPISQNENNFINSKPPLYNQTETKENILSTQRESTRKQSRISKIIQRFSPKLIRRSQSIPSNNSKDSSYLSKNSNIQHKSHCDPQLSIYKETIPNSNHIDSSEPGNKNSKPKNDPQFNDNSRRLFNSIKLDRLDQPQNKFRTISKRRSEGNSDICVPEEMNRKDRHSINIVDISHDQGDEAVDRRTLYDQHQRPSSTNARYVNISLCAFGYGPHQSVYKSPIDKSPINHSHDYRDCNSMQNSFEYRPSTVKPKKKTLFTDL